MTLDDVHVPCLEVISRRRKWLVGVSGGADSVALLWMLHEAGFRRLVVCHLHHGLRGRAADADARFVVKLAEELGYPCEVGRVDVRERMRERNESMETAARGERLVFFASMARKHRCGGVLLAHHADDQAETVLWNLMRGSHGLRGMKKESRVVVDRVKLDLVRPLLGLRSGELKDWLRRRGRKWREDESNREPVAVRNRLRNDVIPLLGCVSGRDPVPGLCRLAADLAEMDEWMAAVVESARVIDPQGRIHLGALSALPRVLQRRALADFLRGAGVPGLSRALLDAAVGLADKTGPAVVNLPGGERLRRSGGRLWIDR